MPFPTRRPSIRDARRHTPCGLLLALAIGSSLAGCRGDYGSAPSLPVASARSRSGEGSVSICHARSSDPRILTVSRSALSAHLGHGDYVARLEVGDVETPDGTVQFLRLTDALAEVRAGRLAREELTEAACRITIDVAAGVRRGSTTPSADPSVEALPFVIDVPDVSMVGALIMSADAAGRATGESDGGAATTLAPTAPLVIVGGAGSMLGAPQPIIVVNGHPEGSAGHGAVIEGFAFQSGRAATDTTAGGFGVLAMRVRNLVVRGNRFEGGLSSAMDFRASSAVVERNHLSGRGSSCDVCLAGPGDFVVRDNRIIVGGIPGVLVLPAVVLPVPPGVEQYTPPSEAQVTALVTNNVVRDHLRRPVGVGVRIGAVGVGAPNVIGTGHLVLTDNEIVNNTFGLIIEGAFVREGSPKRGDLSVTTSGNDFRSSCQNHVLLSMSNSQTALGIASAPYLRASTFTLALGADLSWDDAWYAHPAGFGNTLLVNGVEVPNGTRRAYDATRVCGG